MSRETIIKESPLEIVNIVGSGNLGHELDLEQISQDINVYEANYEKNTGSVFLRIDEDSGLVILYRTGKYIVRGGKEFEKLYRTNEKLIDLLIDLGVLKEKFNQNMEVNNLVFVGDLDHSVELELLVIQLGLENAEFEPEQFPGLIYRPSDFNCVLLVFGSGKVVITGSASIEEATEAFESLSQEINNM
ncbi:TATA-box-binding protein [Halorubrum ezzemoulense]|uniref:TATA-box-binding protein n=1 Tax=Halorubrum ezzemoulense TaxID=337243 RepID=UPI002330225A|nr:transcription factor [Halorubrum ezzemoulense]MDB2239193.1 transcription factor [Halorubrum ezzemoulense]